MDNINRFSEFNCSPEGEWTSYDEERLRVELRCMRAQEEDKVNNRRNALLIALLYSGFFLWAMVMAHAVVNGFRP